MTKRITAAVMALACILVFAACAGANFSDEMKIPYGRDISAPDGPDSIDRQGDHKNSPYFTQQDYYNMKSSDTLTILPHFQTIQQSSELTCGAACALMVMNYFGRADGMDEMAVAELHPDGAGLQSTSLKEAISMFEGAGGFDLTTTLDYGDRVYTEFRLSTIRQFLADDTPVMVCWNEWGGHWQVIIGYDTMGTAAEQDDVLIMADPYDTTDHNQDGYVVYPAQRFYYNFTTYNFFGEEDGNDMLFIAAKPV